jgi:hypothetical protein
MISTSSDATSQKEDVERYPAEAVDTYRVIPLKLGTSRHDNQLLQHSRCVTFQAYQSDQKMQNNVAGKSD